MGHFQVHSHGGDIWFVGVFGPGHMNDLVFGGIKAHVPELFTVFLGFLGLSVGSLS